MRKNPNAISFERLHKESMKDPAFRYEYQKLQPDFEIANVIINARVKKNISEEELAERMGVKKSLIYRLEGAEGNPSLALIKKLADALDLKVELRFTPR